MIPYQNEIFAYFLAGLVVSFILEHVIRWNGDTVSGKERIFLITLWPFMIVIFIYHFIKGLKE